MFSIFSHRLGNATCQAKSWVVKVANMDQQHWRYSSVRIARRFPGVWSITVSATIDLTVEDNRVHHTITRTSLEGQGLRDLEDAIVSELERIPWSEKPKKETSKGNYPPQSTLLNLERLFKRFHSVARQLKRRRNNREPLVIKDEYDVQYLLHALLKTLFDDIRPEEYSPSQAGASSRIDFILKKEKIAVETKMASDNLQDKKIGAELIVDINRYQTHPDCETLVCFVYDPEGHIKNPVGLENDLSKQHDNLKVQVIVSPH